MDNTSALSRMSFGRAEHGAAGRIKVGVYLRRAIRRIRVSSFYLRSGHDSPIDFLTRTTDAQLR